MGGTTPLDRRPRRQPVAAPSLVIGHTVPNPLRSVLRPGQLSSSFEGAARARRSSRLVEDDPGKFDLPVLARLFRAHEIRRRVPQRAAAASPIIRPRCRFIIAAPGSAIAMCSANWSRAVASSAWSSSRAPIRTRPTTTSRPRIPTGSQSTADGKPRRHWASPEMWVTCGLGPYNFEFMTEVKREIMTRYRVDGIFINRWDGSRHVLLRALPRKFPRQPSGHDLPRTNDPQDPARRAYMLWQQERLFDLWQLWDADGARRSIRLVRDPERRRRRDELARHETHRRACADADGGSSGARGRDAAVGEWEEWQRNFAPTMGHKPIVGIFSVGLEEPYRWKDSCRAPPRSGSGRSTASRMACARGSRNSAGSAARPALAQAGRGDLSLVSRRTKVICATNDRSRAWRSFIRSRPAWFHALNARSRTWKMRSTAGITR